jgi:hypothetical protein
MKKRKFKNMKKYIFLFTILLGICGNARGQQSDLSRHWEIATTNPVTCYGGNDGSVTVRILQQIPMNLMPAEIRIYAGNHSPSNPNNNFVKGEPCSGPGEYIISGLPARASYTLVVYKGDAWVSDLGFKTAAVGTQLPMQFSQGPNINPSTVNCEGNSLFSMVTGGNEPYGAYLYKDGQALAFDSIKNINSAAGFTFKNLFNGNYQIKVVDSKKCNPLLSSIIPIIATPPYSIEKVDSTGVTCYGDSDGSFTVRVSGGTVDEGKGMYSILVYSVYDEFE